MWSSEPPCLVELQSIDDVVDRLIYTATNPVKAGLVEAVHQWPGPKTVRAFLARRTGVAAAERALAQAGVQLAAGDPVEAGEPIVTLEAMKMEHVVVAAAAGRVGDVAVDAGQQVARGDALAVVEP